MSERHTPEPWSCESGHVIAEQTEGNILIANCNASYVLSPLQKALNAERIVACVNACKGMDDPGSEIQDLRQTQDELCKALETIMSSPEKIFKAKSAYELAQHFPVTPQIQADADWYISVIKPLKEGDKQ